MLDLVYHDSGMHRMSQDTIDLLKVLVVTFILMAVSTLVLFYVLLGFALYGAGLPVIGDLPGLAPPDLVPVLVDTRTFLVLGAVFLVASGLALALPFATLDMALLVLAKATALLLVAGFGIFAGLWIYLRLTGGGDLSLAGLNRVVIAFVGFLAFSTVFRTAALRALGPLRFLVALALILLGPILLVSG